VPRYTELSLSAQTAYAELAEATHATELHRTVAYLNGSFASKDVKGRKYWYFQFRDIDGKVRQLYVGPDGEVVRRLISQAGERDARALEPLARAAIALGCERVLPRHFRIIRRLSEYGFFHAGGVLVGTHAFLALGNVLGVRWTEGARTQDVDFAHAGNNISIALPTDLKVDVHQALQSLEMGFLPISSFGGSAGATYLNPKAPTLRLDFLTARNRGGDAPVTPKNLNVALQPLKFMEFVLEHPIQGAVFCEEGSVMVNVPSPARYALHKLLVWGERTQAYRTKAAKDLRQAAALISFYKQYRAQELAETWRELQSRGRGWRSRAEEGLRALSAFAPELQAEATLQSANVKAGSRTKSRQG
jgi:hypothetical protein